MQHDEIGKYKKIKIFVLMFCILSLFILLANQERHDDFLKPEQSKTGPIPPSGINIRGHVFSRLRIQAATVISEVPAYIWRYGCGPTSVGMVIGYYDSHGFPNLIPGDSLSQSANVNSAIASMENYYDYCLPLDYYPNLLRDKSEPPVGDEHKDNCIADYMKTSQSYYHNYYGWSWDSDVKSSYENYIISLKSYLGTSTRYSFSAFSWDSLKNEIINNRPLVFLVDTDGNNETDHFVTVVGFNSDGATNYYGCYNTWDTSIHWYPYRAMAYGRSWGVYSVHTFVILPGLYPPKNIGLQRIENSFIFYKEYINRLSWEANEKNIDVRVKYKLFRKKKEASGDTFQLITELNDNVFNYDDRGLKRQEFYIYRIISFDSYGRESAAVEISN